jgi:hypothetical protein
MKTPERRPETLGLWPGAWVAIILFVPLVVSTLKFGRVFTVQLMAVSFSGHEHASFACEVSAASAS